LKAADILDTLAKQGGKSLQQLSSETEITTSNLSKILETLMYIGYVIRDADKLYYLGSKFLEYQTQNIEAQRLLAISRPCLEKLQKTVDETVHLSVLENNKVVYIDKLEPSNKALYMSSRVGLSRDLYSTGMGKAVLSSFSADALDKYLSETKLIAKAKNTITDQKILKENLALIRQRGYSVDDEEQENDGYCIAVKIEDNRKVVGALSVSFPKFRYTEEYAQKVIDEINKAKLEIEKQM
ncbi:IclR family transcriptional regulator, partial [Streptococcus vicugnae]